MSRILSLGQDLFSVKEDHAPTVAHAASPEQKLLDGALQRGSLGSRGQGLGGKFLGKHPPKIFVCRVGLLIQDLENAVEAIQIGVLAKKIGYGGGTAARSGR